MKIKKIIYYIIILIIILVPKTFFAHEAVSGSNAYSGSCFSKFDWCYSAEGIRISLYKYNGSSLTFYKSIDYETTLGSINGQVANASVMAGKVAYQKKKASIKWDKSKLKVSSDEKFTCFFGSPKCKGFKDGAKSEIISYFKLNSKKSSSIIKKVNSIFDSKLSDTDIEKIYITVEPTFLIFSNSYKVSFYGTIYELLNISYTKNGASVYGIDSQLYYGMPRSIVASKPSAKDKNNFVSYDDDALVQVLSKEVISEEKVEWTNKNGFNYDSYRNKNKKIILSNVGYGIGVFWLGEYGESPTCKKKCSGKSGDSLLECAENYCADSKNSTKKEACIESCGYKKPESYKCDSSSKTTASSSTCQATVKKSKTTCSTSGYTKTVCTETTTVKYPSISNLALSKKMSYTLTTSGSKNCTIYFNYNLFKFNYATQTGSSGRTTLLNKLTYATSKSSYEYEWNTNKNNILTDSSMKVGTVDAKLKLSSSKTNTKLSDSSKKSIKLFADGKTTTKEITSSKKYSSTNSSSIVLNDNISFSKYSSSKINTIVNFNKDSSGMKDTNKCSFKLTPDEDRFSCKIEVISGSMQNGKYTGDVKLKYTATYELKKSGTTSFSTTKFPSGSKFNFNGKSISANLNSSNKITNTITVSKSNGNKTVKGSVTVNGVTKSCNEVVVKFVPSPVEDVKCNVKISGEKNSKGEYTSDVDVTYNATYYEKNTKSTVFPSGTNFILDGSKQTMIKYATDWIKTITREAGKSKTIYASVTTPSGKKAKCNETIKFAKDDKVKYSCSFEIINSENNTDSTGAFLNDVNVKFKSNYQIRKSDSSEYLDSEFPKNTKANVSYDSNSKSNSKTQKILTNQTLSGTWYENKFTVNRIAGNIINLSGEIIVNGKSVVACNDSFKFSKNKTCKVKSISIENTDDDKTIITPKISSGNNLVAPNKYEITGSSANMKCDNSG
ncbi:MAG: hypothetical protein PUD59_01590, partial [bacterium]|nr:hypothetical protein [bacterium]